MWGFFLLLLFFLLKGTSAEQDACRFEPGVPTHRRGAFNLLLAADKNQRVIKDLNLHPAI